MRSLRGFGVAILLASPYLPAFAGGPDSTAVEHGRAELTGKSFLSPAWGESAYGNAGKLFGFPAPDPKDDPAGYASAFNRRYGLHPAPYPNDGLPMGLRRARSRDGAKAGIQVDCMVCHGGSIGGTSYVGLGNTQLDMSSLLMDLTVSNGLPAIPSPFPLNLSRGTNNAAQSAAFLLSFRNADLSWRKFPLLFGAKLPDLDTPPWWNLRKKTTKYYDGRTDVRAHRSNMQFLLGELSRSQIEELEPTFRDIDAFFKSITPPKYPFPIDRAKAGRGHVVFAKTCSRCHGTYAPDSETYPNKVVPIDVVKTDRARLDGISDRLVAHYNATWFAGDYPVVEPKVGYQAPPLDGIWATAPYLHNGSVPTLYQVLNSAERPRMFRRPPSTDFEHYDTTRVGWKAEPLGEAPSASPSKFEAGFLFDSDRFGLGNGGHTFGDKLSEEERMDLIEYLKTL